MHRALRGPRPLVFAHRGGAKIGPENTWLAFDRGLAAGANGLELDVHLSRDGEVVVMHDRTVDRTTDARGPVARFTAAELGQMNVLGSGTGVPLLREVLERYRDVPIIVEMKVSSRSIALRVVDLVRQARALDRVALGSFHAGPLKAARVHEPAIPTGSAPAETRLALYASYLGIAPFWASYRSFQVPERTRGTRIVSERFVRLAHAAGVAVQVWTVDTAAEMTRLLDWGVDAIISDRPDLAVETVRAWSSRRGSAS
ncbi:MAG TPA: glycerophosphodiester phosphodiesterase [Vicinamibacterales bacterium]|nr:glycerophosphodiester phosphodiesterase [Vicinamibacterales bacterium]